MAIDDPNVSEELTDGNEENINGFDKDAGIKIHINIRDKAWKKSLVFTSAMFVVGVLILAAGIYTKSIAGFIVGIISTAMFGFFTFLLINPSQHVSMQMVKGEMSYKQLQEAVAKERFEKPIHFLRGAGKPTRFLVSENWVVLGDKIGTPVYIPKNKVKTIEIRSDRLDITNDESLDGQEHQVPYCYLRFCCDEKHIFECGWINPMNIDRAIYELGKHFPLGPMEVRTVEKDEQ